MNNLSPPYTRQHVASNICGYFDLVSNMLPEIEQPSISGNMLLTRSQMLQATCCPVYGGLKYKMFVHA